ncbi:MAG: GC-type dockerin domain-anchored protein, partial [Phycisphaerales bacterium]
ALHTGPGWVNLPDADEGIPAIPDCPADFNLDGLLAVQDLFDFLNGYFSSNPQADVNGSASITVQDIFDFLAIYFAGCRGSSLHVAALATTKPRAITRGFVRDLWARTCAASG